MKKFMRTIVRVLVIGVLSACSTSQGAPTATIIPLTPTGSLPVLPGFSEDAVRTVASLQQVDAYPLYTMTYQGEYESRRPAGVSSSGQAAPPPGWACSLFTVLLDDEHLLYGRNFDWNFSPALLLFTDPPDGYASVSMVDLEYLEFGPKAVLDLTSLPLEERINLLDAPWLPFDGMNEHGLAIGMAAVEPGNMKADPSRKTIHSLGLIRELLDHARDVDEALATIDRYNIEFDGPPLHYLIADANGKAILVEFYKGEMHVIENERPWHSATNFLLASVKDPRDGHCWRYDVINARLNEEQGQLDSNAAMGLLADVAQQNTQWSVVYQMAHKQVNVAMGRDFATIYTFQIPATR